MQSEFWRHWAKALPVDGQVSMQVGKIAHGSHMGRTNVFARGWHGGKGWTVRGQVAGNGGRCVYVVLKLVFGMRLATTGSVATG
jgi:hypothetical protein